MAGREVNLCKNYLFRRSSNRRGALVLEVVPCTNCGRIEKSRTEGKVISFGSLLADPRQLLTLKHIDDACTTDSCFEQNSSGRSINNLTDDRGVFAVFVLAHC